jgi:cytochrome d ubiquinol oxidase subunit II
MALHDVTAWIMLVSLAVYVLLGGADFGAGVWGLFAIGGRERREAIRDRLGEAIGPIWEANHVWLILVIVLLFTCFPPAFAGIMTALHVPIALMLIGIVMRGSAFVFRMYAPGDRPLVRRRWDRVFAVTSLLTPVLLGVTLGTAATGELFWNERGVYTSGFFAPWLRPFPWAVGLFTLAIFAYLAAVYLCAELAAEGDGPARGAPLSNRDLREAFRRRSLVGAVLVGVGAGLTWLLAVWWAPRLAEGLASRWWSIPLQIVTGLAALGAIAALWRRRFVLARTLAVIQVALIVLGYGAAMFPYFVVPRFTIEGAAAPPRTQLLVLVALACGAFLLLPSLWYLYRVFKGRRVFAVVD